MKLTKRYDDEIYKPHPSRIYWKVEVHDGRTIVEQRDLLMNAALALLNECVLAYNGTYISFKMELQ